MQPEVETGKSLFRRFCLIDEGGVHVGTHAFHAELFQVDGLVADVHSSADIVECDFLVKDFPEIGLQFKIQVLGDDEQLYFGGDRIAFRSQRIRRERYRPYQLVAVQLFGRYVQFGAQELVMPHGAVQVVN